MANRRLVRRDHGPPIDQVVMSRVQAHLRARDGQPFGARPPERRPKLELHNKAATDEPAEIRLYDSIGGWFGITADDFAELLDEIGPDRAIKLRINSPGGDVFDGTAIYNLLATRPGEVNVVVDGLAASAASFIAQAGDTIAMNRGTQFMIHDAHGFTIGNAADHRQMVDLLDRISNEIAGIYAARAGSTVAEWRERMLAETWYSAAEAVEAGLADSTADDEPADDDDEGQGSGEPAAAEPAAAAADELTDEEWAAVGEALRVSLDETFDPMAGYDPQVVGSLIADIYGDAPAPPPVKADPPLEPVNFVDEFVKGIQEGVRP
jgi:ATP-dependent protease ClpP protease subunit